MLVDMCGCGLMADTRDTRALELFADSLHAWLQRFRTLAAAMPLVKAAIERRQGSHAGPRRLAAARDLNASDGPAYQHTGI